MTRTVSLPRAALASLLIGVVFGCGQGGPTSAARPGPAAPAAASTDGPASPRAPAGQTGDPGGGSRPATPSTSRTPTPGPRSSPTATASAGLPEILSFSGQPSRCAAASGTVPVKLTWASKNATEAWMTNPAVASAAGDPKTTQGAIGPLTPNGSTTMTFDCRSDFGYYDLGVYGRGQPAGEILQVPRSM